MKNLKIGLIGNMNNILFTLTRYLRDLGTNAELLLLENEYEHFRPGADTYSNEYEKFTKVLPWGKRERFHATQAPVIKSSLAGYDKIICCDVGPAYLSKAGMAADIFVPHGSDLFGYPFQNIRNYVKLDFNQVYFANMQKKGILAAKRTFWGEKGSQMNNVIRKLGIQDKTQFVPATMVYLPDYSAENIETIKAQSQYYPLFQRLRRENDIVIFHHARQFWKFKAKMPWNQKKVQYHYKGNDLLIRAFARFVKQHPSMRSMLILFEYGLDVPHSRQLIADLGIEQNVYWMPVMPRKEIMLGITMADIGTGEFIGGWYSAGVVYENLALGKPLFHFCDIKDANMYPFVNVRTEEEIYRAFEHYIDDPAHFKGLGEQGAAWYQKNIIDAALNEYVRVLTT